MQRIEEPDLVQTARMLTQVPKMDFAWLKESFSFLAKIPNYEPKDGKIDNIDAYWFPQYGSIKYSAKEFSENLNLDFLWWDRPDGGPFNPHFVFPINTLLTTKQRPCFYMYVWLHAFMMCELKKNEYASYISVDGPPHDWHKYTVYLDGQELTNGVWACALTGTCLVNIRNEKGQFYIDKKTGDVAQEKLKGHIIVKRSEDQAFF